MDALETSGFLRSDARQALRDWKSSEPGQLRRDTYLDFTETSISNETRPEQYAALVKEINEGLAKKWNQVTSYRSEFCKVPHSVQNVSNLVQPYAAQLVDDQKRDQFNEWLSKQDKKQQQNVLDGLRKLSAKLHNHNEDTWKSTYVTHYPLRDVRPRTTGMINFHQASSSIVGSADTGKVFPRTMPRQLGTSLGLRNSNGPARVRAPKRKPKLMPHLQKSGNLIGGGKNTFELGSTYKVAYCNARSVIPSDTPQLKFTETASTLRVIPNNGEPPSAAIRLPILKEAPGRDVMRHPQRTPTNFLLSKFRSPEQSTEGSNTVYGLEYTEKSTSGFTSTINNARASNVTIGFKNLKQPFDSTYKDFHGRSAEANQGVTEIS